MTLVEEVRRARRLPAPTIARAIREAAGVTQERLAAELGVHRVTLARWEAGAAHPRGSVRAQYADLLAALHEETTT